MRRLPPEPEHPDSAGCSEPSFVDLWQGVGNLVGGLAVPIIRGKWLALEVGIFQAAGVTRYCGTLDLDQLGLLWIDELHGGPAVTLWACVVLCRVATTNDVPAFVQHVLLTIALCIPQCIFTGSTFGFLKGCEGHFIFATSSKGGDSDDCDYVFHVSSLKVIGGVPAHYFSRIRLVMACAAPRSC